MKTFLKTFGGALCAVLAIAAMAFSLGVLIYNAGVTNERIVWVDKEAKQAKKFADDLAAEVKRGQAASKKYEADKATLQASYTTLEGQYAEIRRRVSLVLSPAVPARRSDIGRSDVAHAAIGSAADAQPAGEAQHPDVGRDYRLSRAAVWMWNSSLQGTDVPSGACGLADTSSEACAADAGVTVDDAWDNHHVNAKSCAADRLRHRALIEFITESPAK